MTASPLGPCGEAPRGAQRGRPSVENSEVPHVRREPHHVVTRPPHTCPQASPTEGGHCTLGQGHARVTPQDTAWEEALAGHGSPEDTLRTPRRLGASERGDISTEGCSLRGHRPPSHRLPDREPCRLLSKRHPTPRPVPQMLADAGRAQPPGRHLPPR